MKVIKINESLVEYFISALDLNSVSREFREMVVGQFKTKVEESLGCDADKEKKVFWVKCK